MFVMVNLADMFPILFLVFMECALSMDNALALALVVKPLPRQQQNRALIYGIWGAILFRIVALFLITRWLDAGVIRILGGLYLLYLGSKYFLFDKLQKTGKRVREPTAFNFWRTVLEVEMLDIVFSVDSVLASLAITQRYWVLLFGAALGILMMRLFSSGLVRLMELFPYLESVAYWIIMTVGVYLVVRGLF